MCEDAKGLTFWAECKYPNKLRFGFHTPLFSADSWEDAERKAKTLVADAWETISPHPGPTVISIRAGYFVLVNAKGEQAKYTEFGDDPVVGQAFVPVEKALAQPGKKD